MSFVSAPERSRWADVLLGGAGRAVSYCGDTLAATTLALSLQARGDHGPGVAALLIAAALPLAVFGSPAGWLADRVDSRRLVVTTALAQAGVCGVLAFTRTPTAMIGLVALLAFGSALTQPALSALTPEMVTTADLPKAMSVMQTAGTLGMLTGPALGGVLVGAYGSRVPLLLDASSFVLLAVAALAIRARRGGRRRAGRSSTGPSTTGPATADAAVPAVAPVPAGAAPVWTLRGDQIVRTLLFSLAAVVASVTAVTVAEVFFVRGTLGSSPATYGVVSSMWELGFLVGVWPYAKLRGDDTRLVRVMLLTLAAVSLVVLGSAAVPAALWLVPVYLVGGGLNGGLNVIVGTIVGRRVPAAVRGRVSGTFGAVAAGANLAGYVVGGLLLPVMTPRSLIAASAVLSLVVALGFALRWVTAGTRRAAVPAVVAAVD